MDTTQDNANPVVARFWHRFKFILENQGVKECMSKGSNLLIIALTIRLNFDMKGTGLMICHSRNRQR
jgi:hypothetical protein